MEHGTVVEGEESDEETTMPEMHGDTNHAALHDLSRPVHAVFAPSTINAGTVCEGEEDSDDEEEALPADSDTKEFHPDVVKEEEAPAVEDVEKEEKQEVAAEEEEEIVVEEKQESEVPPIPAAAEEESMNEEAHQDQNEDPQETTTKTIAEPPVVPPVAVPQPTQHAEHQDPVVVVKKKKNKQQLQDIPPPRQSPKTSPRRSGFQTAIEECHAGAFDSPIQSAPNNFAAHTKHQQELSAKRRAQEADDRDQEIAAATNNRPRTPPPTANKPSRGAAGDESPLQLEDSPVPEGAAKDPHYNIPEAHPPHDPDAFRNALVIMLNRKKKDTDAVPQSIPKPNIPLKEPQDPNEDAAKMAARGDFSKVKHHPLCSDINDAKYSCSKSVLEATMTIGAAVSSNADVHAHRIRGLQSNYQTTAELGNVLNEAVLELCKEVGFAGTIRR